MSDKIDNKIANIYLAGEEKYKIDVKDIVIFKISIYV